MDNKLTKDRFFLKKKKEKIRKNIYKHQRVQQNKVNCLKLNREGEILTDDIVRAEMSHGFSLSLQQKD